MMDGSKDSKLGELAASMGVGTAAAAVIWLGGSPELSWLGYVASGLAWYGSSVRCSLRGNRFGWRRTGS